MRADPVILRRSGDAPLRLDGPSLAASATTKDRGHDKTRWHEIDVWEADSLGHGRYALSVTYRTQWEAETEHHHVAVVPRSGIRDAIRAYDPIAPVMGYRAAAARERDPHGRYTERQRVLELDLRSRFDAAVSEVLEVLDVWMQTDPMPADEEAPPPA